MTFALASMTALSAAEILFQVWVVTRRPPYRGATLTSSMYFASRKTCSSSAGYGGIGAASIIPVLSFNCAGMSPEFNATGRKPFCLYHCTIRSSPCDVNSLEAFTSVRLVIGFFENSCTHPALPQASTLKPLASSRFSSSGLSLSSTWFASSSDANRKGTPNTLKASSMDDRPGSVNRLPCS